ncbi:DnaT-like ssDNA-binding domain-containing protein [Marinobacterium lutimaris]|nr:DnaT-like ssDNA-binding domain-containing protein [Marinobacterium lutimaris]
MQLMVDALQARIGNPGRKLVLIKLADNANDHGECWPSYQHVADQCEMGRSTVKSHIKALADDGFIKIKERNDGRSSNRYVLTIAKGKSSNLTRSKSDPVKNKPGQNSKPTRSESAPHPVNICPGPGQDLTPEPVTEPISESVIEPDDAGEHDAAGAFDPDHIPTDQLPDHEQALFDQPSSAGAVVPFPKASDSRERFEMHFEWVPRDGFYERAQAAGVVLSKIETDQADEILGEFRSYWNGEAVAHTQSQWEHKLIRHLKRHATGYTGVMPPPAGSAAPAVDRREARRQVSAALMDIHDTSWGD